MSRRFFPEVCDECYEPVFRKALKMFIKAYKRCGKPLEDMVLFSCTGTDHLGQEAFFRLMSSMFVGGEIHRQCLLRCVADENFDANDFQFAQKFSDDLDLLHVFCEAHPDQKEDIFEKMLSLAKMPIDVYRYVLENSQYNKSSSAKSGVVFSALQSKNFDLAQYVFSELDKDFDSEDVGNFLWSENGSEILSCYPEFKSTVVQVIDDLSPEDDNNPILTKNIKNLLEKNYICAGDICYKIQ